MTNLRLATREDVPEIQELISVSVRTLSRGLYTSAQAEAALTNVFGVDSQLIADQTYYVIDDGARILAAGGWSSRQTLYGGDQLRRGADPALDPALMPARIRAFFVHPDWTRRGFARRIFAECESAAKARGFAAFELVATLPGEPLYDALGFVAVESVSVPLPDGLSLPCVRMRRAIIDTSL